MILLGLGVWVAIGVCGGLLARWLRPTLGAGNRLAILWAVFGATLGGIVTVMLYVPEVDWPWDTGPLAGAALGGLLVSLLHGFAAGKKQRSVGSRRRVFSAVLLLGATVLLASTAWFVLARANPRLYRPEVNPALDLLEMDDGLADPDTRRDFIELVVATYLTRDENAGIAVGTSVAGDRMVVSGGLGSRMKGSAPVDASSVFEIGSMSKIFAGVALAEAVVAGEVRLDQEVETLLPGRRPPVGIEKPPSITLGQLATHSAGLPEYPVATPWWTALTSDNPYAELTDQELLGSFEQAARATSPDRSYQYSSFGFTLLSYLLERATGVAYPRLLDHRIFDPLGMHRTQVPVAGADVPGLVTGHSHGQPVPHWIGHDWAGAAGVVSTADDLLAFAEAYWSPESDSLKDALSMAAVDHGLAWGTRKMGLGWHIVDEGGGPRVLYHSGSTLGFYSYIGLAPELRVAVVVLANSSDPSAAAIGARMLKALAVPK